MAAVIKDGKVATDFWLRLELNADGSAPPVPEAGDVIVPLTLWRTRREQLVARPGRVGVWLASHEDPGEIGEDLRLFGVVAVDFPAFTDGRGYSIGRLLRERYGYRGELRAIGDVFRDQLYFLESCGFDAFALRDGEDPREALGALADFSEAYQASVASPLPLFRRRYLASPDGMEWS